MRTLLSLLVCGAATAVALVHPAGAAGDPAFSGRCSFSGTETFRPPLSIRAGTGSATVVAAGTCTGTLTTPDGARSVRKGVAGYEQQTSAALISCVGGVARGTGTVTIDGIPLPFAVAEPQLTVLSTLTYRGDGWSGRGVASVAPSANPLALALACASRGIAEVPVVLTVVANTG